VAVLPEVQATQNPANEQENTGIWMGNGLKSENSKARTIITTDLPPDFLDLKKKKNLCFRVVK
jgi:hypothetical protein